jgi:FMN phosphatase YigB (HAD superfamily)
MDHIKAIGFDLFNTLIIAEAGALDEAMRRLMTGLAENGVCPESEPFRQAYREAALGFIRKAAKDGIETHNRFWISAALKLIDLLGLDDFFEVVLISGEMGFRKPHPRVFDKLAGSLGVDGGEMLYVGDDPEADIGGALSAGIQAVWFTYARDRKSPFPLGARSDPSEIPAPEIPSISSWGELLALLHR